MEPLKNFILSSLNFFYGFAGDYGLAIILLTVAMRVVLLPLTLKSTKSQYELQRIQPKIKELQEKYKNNKEKLQEETLKFYQENKVNPFGGCLPLLLQMPVFIALFNVLRNPKNLPGGQFLFILPDLTTTPAKVFGAEGLVAAIPYLIFVVLFGLSVWLPQRMMTKEKQQQQIGMYMAVMFLFFGWSSPAGVLLYWVTSSVLQIVQQVITTRIYARAEGA